ncbi:sensor histidine kinase [Leptolyngbya sp. 7M]|uniref:sensor histidine kinase n=1 Tax=Leptolyngbya sp. 7M TaxID=2812896 RepID=UPI001B8C917E|nr:ATP-binding protein [Leptolyngbya sp. 7M]QYO66131.1 HAMP domain-containing protein [Leptolyngbya sp. 7M]
MTTGSPKRIRLSLWLLGAFVLFLLTILLLLQTSNIWKDFSVESAGDTLLLYGLSSLNFAAFVVFGFIFLRSIVRLIRERKALQLGSKLKTRLLFYFVMISILPIIAMAGFSILFMNRAIDRWFTQIPENIVRLPQDLQKRAIENERDRMNELAAVAARSLGQDVPTESDLRALLSDGGLVFAGVIGEDGRYAIKAVSKALDDAGLSSLGSGELSSPTLSDGYGVDAFVATLPDGRRLVIGTVMSGDPNIDQAVVGSLQQYDRLKASQITVRQVGFLTLGVLTFMLIFAAMWTAFYIARGLATPLRSLAEGAQKIAEGELGYRVDVMAEDELALLVSTFNEMSAKLEANSAELTERRRYIETVLLSLPTGVISLNAGGLISTINPAARKILGVNTRNLTGTPFSDLLGEADRMLFDRIISRARRVGHASDQSRLMADAGEKDGASGGLAVSIVATALPEGSGVVLVLEDLSELIAAQRASAWQEVARRMAHEIKNPLTPIQLSAERIARRFAVPDNGNESIHRSVTPNVDDKTQLVVKEGTATIIREVQSLKSMVDEFSRFARLPETSPVSGNINEVIEQAAELYAGRSSELTLEMKLAGSLPNAFVDAEQLKRVFVNLIDNAIEAPGPEEKVVTISSRHDTARDIIVIEVADNGKGIDPPDLQKLFQPYFSTKGRGTGLGLAIVQRIIAEHQGKIKAVANQPRGAKFIVEIPVKG